MLTFEKGDLLQVTIDGLMCTVGNGNGLTSDYLAAGEHLLVIELPVMNDWESWHETKFIRVKTSEALSIVMSLNADSVFCFRVLNGIKDLYPSKLDDALKVIPR